MVWVRSPVYFYKRNETFYFSRAILSDLLHRFDKRKIEVSLRTKSEAKAAKSAAALSDRLERYWDSLRMDLLYLFRCIVLSHQLVCGDPRTKVGHARARPSYLSS